MACSVRAASGTPPVNTVPPTITSSGDIDNPQVGDVLTYHAGTWTGDPIPTVTHTFRKFLGSVYTDVGTGTTFIIPSGVIGAEFFAEEKAVNVHGLAYSDSNFTGPVSYDPDAATYFALRNSITSSVQKNAINQLTLDLKSAGIWSGIDVLVPLVFGSFSDLFSPLIGPTPVNNSFISGDFTAFGLKCGLKGNGASYIDTGFSNDSVVANNSECAVYITVDQVANVADLAWGRDSHDTLSVFAYFGGNDYAFSGSVAATTTAVDSLGLAQSSRTTSTRIDLYRDGASVANSTTANSASIQAGETGTAFAIRTGVGTVGSYSSRSMILYARGTAMDSTQAAAFYTAVNNFAARAFTNTSPATLAPIGPFIYPGFNGDGDETLRIYQSNDGIGFARLSASLSPSSGTCRDPSLLIKGSTWVIAYTSISFSPGTTFGVCSGDSTARSFTTIKNVDCSGAIVGVDTVWGPKWFTDPADNSEHIIVAISATGDSLLQEYEVHPVVAGNYSGAWSTPALVDVAGRTNIIDGFIFTRTEDPGNYYLIFKNETSKYLEIAISSSPFSGYTIWKDAATLGMDNQIEGCSVVNLGSGTYRIYYDAYAAGTGMHYVDTTTFEAVGSGTAIGSYTAAANLRNGVFLKA